MNNRRTFDPAGITKQLRKSRNKNAILALMKSPKESHRMFLDERTCFSVTRNGLESMENRGSVEFPSRQSLKSDCVRKHEQLFVTEVARLATHGSTENYLRPEIPTNPAKYMGVRRGILGLQLQTLESKVAELSNLHKTLSLPRLIEHQKFQVVTNSRGVGIHEFLVNNTSPKSYLVGAISRHKNNNRRLCNQHQKG